MLSAVGDHQYTNRTMRGSELHPVYTTVNFFNILNFFYREIIHGTIMQGLSQTMMSTVGLKFTVVYYRLQVQLSM